MHCQVIREIGIGTLNTEGLEQYKKIKTQMMPLPHPTVLFSLLNSSNSNNIFYMIQLTVLLTFSITFQILVFRAIFKIFLLKCATQTHRCGQSYTEENDPGSLLQGHMTLELSYNEITNTTFLYKLFSNLVNTFLNQSTHYFILMEDILFFQFSMYTFICHSILIFYVKYVVNINIFIQFIG